MTNGWLTVAGRPLMGVRYSPPWWRGTMRATDAAREFGPSVTRFAPGRFGAGLTDDIPHVIGLLAAGSDNFLPLAAYDHHYGLWYDRRRDDHLMVRRADGDVVPPFYEQPFARSGEGTAWDGLSKYDLTRYNPWYWGRLHQLAEECDEHGAVLIHEHFFQHNILEAGAHWVDCPWRPANCVNDVELPEPPPFIGDKRLFMAQHFYDPANKRLRALQRAYIRQCLDAAADCTNVMHATSAEYTGPVEFVEFWLDVIAEWQRDTGRDALVALSCPKNVQDALLADEARRAIVDVIDIRYWCYDKNLKLYAPEGGTYLAPRQHMRQLRPEASSFAAIVKAVADYRDRYPDKAVTYFAGENCRTGQDCWAVLAGRGSLAELEPAADWAPAVVDMKPAPSAVSGGWALADEHGKLLIVRDPQSAATTVRGLHPGGRYRATWIESTPGAEGRNETLAADAQGELVLNPRRLACMLEPAAK